MQINPVNNTNNCSFKTWHREVFAKSYNLKSHRLLYRNDTSFFRDRDLWVKLLNFFIEKFQNIPKVNVYHFGCSDGSEPLSLIMYFLSNTTKAIQEKFLPVKALDIDKEAINRINTKFPYKITDIEINRINDYTENNFNKFFKNIPSTDNYKADDILYSNIDAKLGNIKTDYKNIEKYNSIIFARNFWPYIENPKERQTILCNLANHLKSNSYLAIGEYDIRGSQWTIEDQIKKAGFQKTSIRNLYEKI